MMLKVTYPCLVHQRDICCPEDQQHKIGVEHFQQIMLFGGLYLSGPLTVQLI